MRNITAVARKHTFWILFNLNWLELKCTRAFRWWEHVRPDNIEPRYLLKYKDRFKRKAQRWAVFIGQQLYAELTY